MDTEGTRENTDRPLWQVTGGTLRGTSHVANNLPNQDAVAWYCEDEGPLVLATADGHGSPRCFRSDRGSRFAVESATEVLRNFSTANVGRPGELESVAVAAMGLPQRLVAAWRDKVLNDQRGDPWPSGECGVEADSTLPYGATLLAVLVTSSYIVYAQLGDGDILCSRDGKTTRCFPKDERFGVDETTSLCLPDASSEMRVRVVPYDCNVPTVIVVCSDGYVNSFGSDGDFLQVGQDYEEMIADVGFAAVAERLDTILQQTSTSGDDVTVGIIARRGRLPRRSPSPSLSALDEASRTVLELAYFGGFTQREVARRTGLSLPDVKQQLRLAMRHLRELSAATTEGNRP